MKVALNKAHYPVTALGYGVRLGIWLQGCSIGCRGCLSRDTWASSVGHEVDADDLVGWCRDAVDGPLDGITISGGEPFEQPVALHHLVSVFAGWRRRQPHLDLLCYSGLPESRLRRDHSDTLALLDALIPEPFVERRPDGAIWRGSDNQPLVALSPLGERRYGPFATYRPDRPPFQVEVGDEAVWYIGVPRRGDLGRLDAAAQHAGIRLGGASWTS